MNVWNAKALKPQPLWKHLLNEYLEKGSPASMDVRVDITHLSVLPGSLRKSQNKKEFLQDSISITYWASLLQSNPK